MPSSLRDWSCHGTGDCCRSLSAVVMTIEERRVLEVAASVRAPHVKLTWNSSPSTGFESLRAAPCPILDGSKCSLYDVRPYNCRRFMCFRSNPNIEPLRVNDSGVAATMMLYLESDRGARRAYSINQRKAQKWAVNHGWTPDSREAGS